MLGRVAGITVCWIVGGLIAASAAWAGGDVYALTNALGNNQVLVYHRADSGRLTLARAVATGGGGSGVQLDPTDSLGAQGAVLVDRPGKRLFAVNTETIAEHMAGGPQTGDCRLGTISSFRILPGNRLKLQSRVSSDGMFPSSLALHGNLLYVLNAGGPGLDPSCGTPPNVTGFAVAPNAELSQLTASTRPIDPGTSPGSFLNCDPGAGPFATFQFQCGLNPPAFPRSPAQVGFSPDGRRLLVTVKGTNTIDVFRVQRGGGVEPLAFDHVGSLDQPTPFGFAFTPGAKPRLLVAEPFGASPTIPAAQASAVSSYTLGSDGTLAPVSASVANGQGTTCWVAIAPNGRFAYVSNNLSNTISSYAIGSGGRLTLLAKVAASANRANDLAIAVQPGASPGRRGRPPERSSRGRHAFLYALAAGDGTVDAWRINGDGSLSALGSAHGLPVNAGAQGLSAY